MPCKTFLGFIARSVLLSLCKPETYLNKNKTMIQTNYVALEHPYRVIYYNGVVGLQIGSLIVTTEKQDEAGGSVVKIKSHPVVSYCSTEAKKNINRISYPGVFSEAVVWDQVEQNNVTTLCVEGGSIGYDDFMCEIGQSLWKRGLKNGMMKAADTAIQDMADNHAKMGTDIESIQMAYQGFAKQNYTMLDNLKLGKTCQIAQYKPRENGETLALVA